MDTFNSAIKLIHIENQEYVINGIKISKSKSFNANINGIEKVIEIINLPDNYKAIVGIEDSEEASLGNKTVFGKFFIKVYDSFNREVNDFLSHHKLASGLDLKLRLTNIDSPKVSIENEMFAAPRNPYYYMYKYLYDMYKSGEDWMKICRGHRGRQSEVKNCSDILGIPLLEL